MTVFEYIIGIHSIVLGLAIASLLSTFAEQLKYREAKHLYWVHSAWCLTLLFFIVSGWWGYWYTFEAWENMSIFLFLYSFQYSIAMYLCARFLSPDPLRESETTSIEDYYFRIKTPFLSIFMYGMITWPIGEYLGLYSAETTALSLADLLGLAAIFVLLLAAILSSNRNVHGVVVIAILVLQVAGEVAQGSLHQ